MEHDIHFILLNTLGILICSFLSTAFIMAVGATYLQDMENKKKGK